MFSFLGKTGWCVRMYTIYIEMWRVCVYRSLIVRYIDTWVKM